MYVDACTHLHLYTYKCIHTYTYTSRPYPSQPQPQPPTKLTNTTTTATTTATATTTTPSIRLRRQGKSALASDDGAASVLARMAEFGVQHDETTRALLASLAGNARRPPLPPVQQAVGVGGGEGAVALAAPSRSRGQEAAAVAAPAGGLSQQEQEEWALKRVKAMEAALQAKLDRQPGLGGDVGVCGEEEVLEVLRACVEAEDDVSERAFVFFGFFAFYEKKLCGCIQPSTKPHHPIRDQHHMTTTTAKIKTPHKPR